MRLATTIVQVVDPADRADDPAGPGLGLAAEQGGRTFAGQRPGQLATEGLVLPIQVFPTEAVGEGHDRIMSGAGRRRDRGGLARILLLPGHWPDPPPLPRPIATGSSRPSPVIIRHHRRHFHSRSPGLSHRPLTPAPTGTHLRPAHPDDTAATTPGTAGRASGGPLAACP